MEHLLQALSVAVEDAEQSLRDQYEKAVRGKNNKVYCTILSAAASLDKPEFSSGALLAELNKAFVPPMKPAALFSYLNRLVSSTNETVLTRKYKGVYRFSDPRMPSFVKMMSNNIVP
jgi:hypothetical protein